MDLYHRNLKGRDTPHGRECRFCRLSDPDFEKRKLIDRLVQSEQCDSASGHLTEDGYVRHRMTEILKRLGTISSNVWLPESA
jgi:hypothetical protein